MSTRLVRLVAAIGVAATVAACGGCGSSEPAGPPPEATEDSGGPIAVVASTNVWANVAEAVGGTAVSVKAIVTDQAGDPHSYQVTAKDAADLRAAALVVYNGGGYDDFVDQALGEGGPRRIRAVDLHPDGSGDEHGSEPHPTTHGFARPAHDTGENEHVWYDLPTVAVVAGEIASQLGQLRPSDKATFIANAEALDARLDTLRSTVGELATAHGGTPVAATEPIAHYLLQAARLTDATPHDYVDATEEETDPPAAAVAEFQRLITERRIALLVHNPQTETPVVADLAGKARAAGLPVVEMTETLPTGQDFVTWMGNQIQALSAALERQ
jgi:zinc/manganese transport system substrate-binding protein